MTARDINNTSTRLMAFRNDPSLNIIWPTPVSAARLDNFAEGMASSAAYAIVRLGGNASLWGAVGDDETGKRIIRELGETGINVEGMLRVEGARSAVSTILVDDDGERLIVPLYDPKLKALLWVGITIETRALTL